MRKLLGAFTVLITFFLCGCGGSGGGEPVPPAIPVLQKAFIHPSDAFLPATGYDVQMAPVSVTNPVSSVALQANNMPNGSILWGGFTKKIGFADWPLYVSESLKYPSKFKYAYVYDEAYLAIGKGTEEPFTPGYHEVAMNNAADVAHAAGLKTVITILPHTIMDPGFVMTAINKYDIIAIDIYVDWLIVNTHGDNYGTNPYSNALWASVRKLRAQGFTGDVWYIYQAFGIKGADEEVFIAKLNLQRETIRDALILGAKGVVPWGMYLGAEELAGESWLRPLGGTYLEPLIRP